MSYYTLILAILQLCCTTESQKNIARNGTASQSSVFTWYNNGSPKDMTADLAITGPPTNDLNSQSCSMTQSNFYEVWWMLTFPVDTVFFTTVKIFHRRDTLYRFASFSLYISNTSITTQTTGSPPNDDLCHHDTGPGDPSMNQSLDCYSLGKNVIIYNNRTKGGVVVNNDPYAYLELCGVQVFGCYKGWFGNNCSVQCPGVCIDKHCFPNNGTCVWGCVTDNCLRDKCEYNTGVCIEGCKPGLAGKFCNKYNLASNTRLVIMPADNNQDPMFAVDGDKTNYSCIKTTGVNWLQVDLKDLSVITSIYLSYKNDNMVKNSSEGHSLFVTNTSGTWTDVLRIALNASDNFPYITYDISPVIGQYVVYVPVTTNRTGYTDICEIEVIGCQVRKYGENCSMSCPINCDDACHPETGDCIFGCSDGWQGVNCDKPCTSPYFGNSCKQVCNCLNNAPCNNVNGTCPRGGCQKGWKGDSCNIACTNGNGSYGYNCNETCAGCLSYQCDTIDGNCNIIGKCNPGWAGPNCNEPCSDGFFGDCKSRCYCLEGACNRTTGICPGLQCQKGWMGDTCSKECSNGTYGFNCENICNTCKNQSCERFEGICHFGCIDGLQLLALSQKKEISQNDLIYAVVGTFIVTVVSCITIFLLVIWRLRRQKTNAIIQKSGGQYENNVFSSTSIETAYEETIPVSDDQPYDIIGLQDRRS